MEINEIMTYDQLLSVSSDRRKDRADNVKYNVPPNFEANEDDNQFIFKSKSVPSETGASYETGITFFKPKNSKLPLERTKCKVDCSCPDYKYTWAFANKKKGSSDIGSSSLNKATNQAPKVNNPRQRTGLCKHLIAVGDYIDGELYKLPPSMPTNDKLGTISSKYKKPLKPLPGADRRKAEIDKIKGIREELNEIKSELLFENVQIKLIDLVDF